MMSGPCSLLVSKIRYPETEHSLTKGKVEIPKSSSHEEDADANVLQAAGNGAATGVQLILLIAGSLLAIVSLFATADTIVQWAFDMINVPTIAFILSYLFYPIAIAIGVTPAEARKAAEFMATKLVVNEFKAYSDLSDFAYKNGTAGFDGPREPNGNFVSNGLIVTIIIILFVANFYLQSLRTIKLLTFALCGFANLASIGIQIGCLGVMAPSRKKDIAALAFSAMLTGTLSTWISAAVAGALL